MPLGDNVQSIRGHAGGRRPPRLADARTVRSQPFDNLLGLAVELEQRDRSASGARLVAVPPPPQAAAPAAPLPPPPAPPVLHVRRASPTEKLLAVGAAALALVLIVLLLFGTRLERMLRPGIERTDRATELQTDGVQAPDGGEVRASVPPTTSASPSTASPPSTPLDPAPVAPPPDAAVPPDAVPVAVGCDAASVWPAVAPLNDIAPISVAWVTCLETYGTVGLVPADAAPETPPSVIVALRADGATWTVLSASEPAACGAAASTVDPAFPTTLCP